MTQPSPQNRPFSQILLSYYLYQNKRVWKHIPEAVRSLPLGQAYGRHLHSLVCRLSDRRQSFGTFFLRNRPELELMRRLTSPYPQGSPVKIAILACSKGAEVYSMLWAIRSARPDLKINTCAVDISEEILAFAAAGIYGRDDLNPQDHPDSSNFADVDRNTYRDQIASIFERMSPDEVAGMFDVQDGRASVRPWLREGIQWRHGNAADPRLVEILGLQDIVVANRFLCHMKPANAESCLRNLVRLVKPGGYLFVSGVDLDVRTKIAREMGWKPVTVLVNEIHEGDSSLRKGWPLEYWGLEPARFKRTDSQIRYASVFQIPGDLRPEAGNPLRASNPATRLLAPTQ